MLFSCDDNSALVYDRACQEAAEKLVASLKDEPGLPREQRTAVVSIENDEEELLRENLIIALNKQNFNLIGMMEHSEMDQVLDANSIQIKYDEHYDRDSLVRLGKLLAPRAIFVSKIQTIAKDKNKAEIILYSKLLDLQLGKIIWADKYHSVSESGAVLKRNVVIFVAVVVLSAIICFLLMLSTGLGVSLIAITVIIDLIAFYLLLFDYVKSLFLT